MEVRDASQVLPWRGQLEWRRWDEVRRREGGRRVDEDRLGYGVRRLELRLMEHVQQQLQE